MVKLFIFCYLLHSFSLFVFVTLFILEVWLWTIIGISKSSYRLVGFGHFWCQWVQMCSSDEKRVYSVVFMLLTRVFIFIFISTLWIMCEVYTVWTLYYTNYYVGVFLRFICLFVWIHIRLSMMYNYTVLDAESQFYIDIYLVFCLCLIVTQFCAKNHKTITNFIQVGD